MDTDTNLKVYLVIQNGKISPLVTPSSILKEGKIIQKTDVQEHAFVRNRHTQKILEFDTKDEALFFLNKHFKPEYIHGYYLTSDNIVIWEQEKSCN